MADFSYRLLRIRFLQLFRMLRSAGWGYLLVLVPILVLTFGFRILALLIRLDPLPAALLLLLPVLSLHLGRRDHFFLRQIATYGQRTVLFTLEYLLLMSPFWIPLIIYGKFLMLSCFSVGLLVLAGLDKSRIPSLRWKRLDLAWIPARAFEWRSGLRRAGLFIAFFWMVGFLASHWVWGIPGILIIVGLVCAGFYEWLEPKELLEGPFDPVRLLYQKVSLHLMVFNLIFSLHYVVFFIRHAAFWWILVLSIAAVNLLLSFSILIKYANWLPLGGKHGGRRMLAVFAIGLMVPYLAPASLGLWVYYYFKARKRLDFFYHAEH